MGDDEVHSRTDIAGHTKGRRQYSFSLMEIDHELFQARIHFFPGRAVVVDGELHVHATEGRNG